jgi:hypothetical protein
MRKRVRNEIARGRFFGEHLGSFFGNQHCDSVIENRGSAIDLLVCRNDGTIACFYLCVANC